MKHMLFAVLFCAVQWCAAIDGLALLDTISDNSWVKLPVTGYTPTLFFGDVIAHTNITVDCERHRVYYYGSDTHGRDYYNNYIMYFDLTTFQWRALYPKDSSNTYIKVTDPVLGSGFWPATNTGHPVPSHVFDACKYIPGKNCLLVIQSSDHNYAWSGAFHNGLQEILGSTGEPVAWLWDCVSLSWTMLKNAVVPRVFIWPMAVSPDGSKIVAVSSSNTYTFDWSDSTWSSMAASGSKHGTYHTAMEYDTYTDRFVECGAHSFEYYQLDYDNTAWQRVNGDAGPPMNGPSIGYDTLNKVLIAHCADNGSNTYNNPGGKAKTWVRASDNGQWTLVKSTDAGDLLPAHYGFGFRGEYDLANNVFYYVDHDNDIWAYRYKRGAGSAVETGAAARAGGLSVRPNPFTSAVCISIADVRAAFIESGAPTRGMLPLHMSIYNTNGQRVAKIPVTGGRAVWDGAGHAPGIYLIKYRMNNTVYHKRMLRRP